MKPILFTLLLAWSYYASGQKMTISGDPTDSTVIRRKQRLEAKGFEVIIQPHVSEENPLLTKGDQAFRQQYIGKPLPAFTLEDLDGHLIDSQELKGKYVHINFWSTTCVPCIQEFPELNALKKKYGDGQWVFLALAPESAEKVKSVVRRRPLNYRVIPNAQAYYDQLGIGGYPKNFFVDKTGIIIQVTDGSNMIQDPQTKEVRPDNYRYYDQIISRMR